MEQKIPKKLHYVWVGGGAMSPMMRTCMESWSRFCPDYEIIEWNERTFDVAGNPWVRRAIEERNFALASDVMRVWILYNHGGIYLDTDIEILCPLDDLLKNEFFMGYESRHWVNTAIIGSVKGHEIMKLALDRYKVPENGECVIDFDTNLLAVHTYSAIIEKLYGHIPNGKTVTLKDGGVALYAKDYFFPLHYLTHKLKLTSNSHVIHRCSCSWHSKSQKRRFRMMQIAYRLVPRPIFQYFEGVVSRGYRKKLRAELDRIEAKTKTSE